MENINLELILKNHIDLSDYDDFTAEARVIDAMREVWNLAVEKCKSNARISYYEGSPSGYEKASYEIDPDSFEQVKLLHLSSPKWKK